MSRALSARLRNRNNYWAIGVSTAIVLIAGCGSNGDTGDGFASTGGVVIASGNTSGTVGGAAGKGTGTGGRIGTSPGTGGKATTGTGGKASTTPVATGGQVNSTCPKVLAVVHATLPPFAQRSTAPS